MSRPPKYVSDLLLAVGEMRADLKHTREQNDRIESKLGEVDDRLRKVEPLVETVREVKEDVDRHNKWEQRGLGIWLVVTLLGSVFGGVVLRKLGLEVA